MPLSFSIAGRPWRLIIVSLLVSQLFATGAQSVTLTRSATLEEEAIGNAALPSTDTEPTNDESHSDQPAPSESVRALMTMATPTPVPAPFVIDTQASDAQHDVLPAPEAGLPNSTIPHDRPNNSGFELDRIDDPVRLQGERAIEMSESVYDALVALYNETDGDNWFNNDGWLESRYVCSNWYGVLCMEPGVVTITLSENNLTGRIPDELSDVTYLSTLNLSFNNLTGGIPASIGRLDRLSHLNLHHNNLDGEIPPELGNLTKLEFLDLSMNDLTGTLPTELGQLTRLRHLHIYDTQIAGPIPAQLGSLTDLEMLDLVNNNLDGEIPAGIWRLPSLRYMNLGNNDLSGSFALDVQDLENLVDLRLFDNNLSGEVPASVGGITSLKVLDIANNQFSGDIPTEIGKLASLEYLILSGNQLTGEVIPSLGDLTSLIFLAVDMNELSGRLPAELGNLRDLTYLNFSGNSLIGMLPQPLVELPLTSLNFLDTNLCAPNNQEFRTWLAGIETVEAQPCPVPPDPSPHTGLDAAALETGDILLRRSNYPPDLQAARVAAATYWFHAAIYIGDGQIAHAIGSQYYLRDQLVIQRIVDTEFWTGVDLQDWVVIRPRTSEDVKSQAAEYAAGKAASYEPEIPYSGDWLERNSEDKFYCSQLVWQAYNKQGLNLEVNLPEVMDMRGWAPREAMVFFLGLLITPDELYASAQSPMNKKSDVVQISTMDIDGVPNAVRRLSTWVLSPADLLLEDPQGRRTGYDPLTDTLYDEIPGVFYDGPNSDPEWLAFRATDEEGWTITVSGTGEGDYLLYSYELGEESSTHQIITNTVVADQVEVFEFPPLDESGDGVLVPEAEDANSSYLPLIHQ